MSAPTDDHAGPSDPSRSGQYGRPMHQPIVHTDAPHAPATEWFAPPTHPAVAPAGPAVGGRVDGVARVATAAPRTIRVRVAAMIAVLAFVIGLGVSMLLGPIMGPGPGGPGGPGGTSISQTTTQQGAGSST